MVFDKHDVLDRVHLILFGKPVADDDAKHFVNIGVISDDLLEQDPAAIYATVARRMIAMRERSLHPTPFSVKIRSSEISFISIEGFEIALDLADHSIGLVIAAHRELDPALTDCFKRYLRPGMNVLESVRDHHGVWHSFLIMRRTEAQWRKARAFRLWHSQSLASRRQRFIQAKVRSTIHRLGSTMKALDAGAMA